MALLNNAKTSIHGIRERSNGSRVGSLPGDCVYSPKAIENKVGVK